MGLSEVDRKLMAMYRRLPEVHRRQLQVYRKQKKLSTVGNAKVRRTRCGAAVDQGACRAGVHAAGGRARAGAAASRLAARCAAPAPAGALPRVPPAAVPGGTPRAIRPARPFRVRSDLALSAQVRRKVMHMRDQQLYYHRLRMWLEDQLRQERERLLQFLLKLNTEKL